MYYSTGQYFFDVIVNRQQATVHENIRSTDGQDAGNEDAIMEYTE